MENSTLHRLVTRFDQAVEEIAALKLPRLSPTYNALSGRDLHAALVSHRVLNTYEVPGQYDPHVRKVESIASVLHHDSHGMDHFDYRTLSVDTRRDFLHAKSWLADFFKDFRHSYALRFPTGEGFNASRGHTDLFFKLRDAANWSISPDLVTYLVEILIRNRALYAVVKQRYRDMHGPKGLMVLRRLSRAAWSNDQVDTRREMARFYIRATMTLNRVSRVTTVPKNTTSDRVITCESLWTMVCQLSYSASLRDHMLRRLGINLDSWQQVHRALIRSGKATIDLSKASDSNYMCVLRTLWPASQVRYLNKMRTGVFDQGIDCEYHPLKMFAPMGCGCTFEVMTLTLLSHVRVLDPGGSVFGDDIIVEASQAQTLMSNLKSMGWKINEDKSFWNGSFRESCGAFADLSTNSLLLSYDWHRPTSLADCYTLAHKVLHLGTSMDNGKLRSILVSLYRDLHVMFPRDSLVEMDSRSTNPYLGLTASQFFGIPQWVKNRRVSARTKVTRLIEQFYQRPVHVQMLQVSRQKTRLIKRVGVIEYVCYMRRGVYSPQLPVFQTYTTPTEAFSGTPVNQVPLLTVL